MKTSVRSIALAAAATLFLLGGSTAAFADTSTSLNLTVPYPTGYVTNLGTQNYVVSGGQALGASIGSSAINFPSTQYSFTATENDGSVNGYGTIRLAGTITGEGRVTVSGSYQIDDDIAIGSAGPNVLPGYFVSDAPSVTIKVAGSPQALEQPLLIETPYANPWGGPIVIESYDCLATGGVQCTFLAVVTYSVGTITWQGAQVTGGVTGRLGSTPVTGTITDTGDEVENLVSGTAVDQGTTTLSISGTGTSLSVTGTYSGSDTIPQSGTSDCSSALTGIEGTCTYTGFQSNGQFSAQGVSGTYSTTWTAPALYFGSTIQATVTQGGQPISTQGGYNGHWSFGGFFSRLSGFF